MGLILNIFRADKKNHGDWLSPPMRYVKFSNYETKFYDFIAPPISSIECDVLIIGGGGLISTKQWYALMNYWVKTVKAKYYILWGVGIDREFQSMNLKQKFNLIGARQKTNYFDFIPCASCLHPFFNELRKVEGHGEIKISHFKRIIPNSKFTNLEDFRVNIERIQNSEKVITTSYHIYYWAKLLGKQVEIYNSTNFIKPLAEKMFTLPDFNLDESRALNISFFKKVECLINS